MKSVKGQSYVQKHLFFFFFPPDSLGCKSEVFLLESSPIQNFVDCCSDAKKKGKRQVSIPHGKRSLQKASKLKNSLYLKSSRVNTEKSSLSLL